MIKKTLNKSEIEGDCFNLTKTIHIKHITIIIFIGDRLDTFLLRLRRREFPMPLVLFTIVLESIISAMRGEKKDKRPTDEKSKIKTPYLNAT